MSKRPLRKDSLFLLMGTILCCLSCKGVKNMDYQEYWRMKEHIEQGLKEPSFPNREYNVIDYGAVSDGLTKNTTAFSNAIRECSEAGGGIVRMPRGKYLTGPIHLDDNVNLHLEKDAEILFSTDSDDYPLVETSFEGIELMNFSPLIYAKGKKNIAITGEGVLNGQADNHNWWPWKGQEAYGWEIGAPDQNTSLKKLKEEMIANNVPVKNRIFGKGDYLRPSFFELFECENVLIKNVTIINAPCWVIHPFRSQNVIIDGVKVDSHGPNNDGCDPEYSKNVIIKNCTFNTGDDCIAIKSGRNEDGRRVGIKSENIVVQNCKMIDGHGGVVIGSEISAGVQNVFVEDCEMDSPNLDRAIRIKSNTKRGGIVENIFVRNLKVGQVKEAVLKINLFYGIYGEQTGKFIPEVRNILLENVQVKDGGAYAVLIKGHRERPVENIVLKDVNIGHVTSPYEISGATGIRFINTHINDSLYNVNIESERR